LVCIGETLAEREAGRADEVLARQVRAALALLTPAEKQAEILVAYEPVWAIGVNGIPATMDYANARHEKISAVVEAAMGRRLPLLYGGSVNPANCAELVSQAHIDGLFIGRSAWTVEGYLDILKRVASAV
jgi:triosephosphate isomerase